MNPHTPFSSGPNRSGFLRAFWWVAAIYFLFVTGLCAATFDDFVLLMDTSGAKPDDQFRRDFEKSLYHFAESLPTDTASRVSLFAYDTELIQRRMAFVLSDGAAKATFEHDLEALPNPRGRVAMTWTALMSALDRLPSGGKESSSISIHLFVDGLPKDPDLFAKALAKFKALRSQRPNVQLYYHAIGQKPAPDEVVSAAAGQESGLIVITGLHMPPQILRSRVLPAGASLVAGTPVRLTGAAVDAHAWQWDFGDKSSSTEPNPTHTYVRSGKYKLKVTASSDAGKETAVFNLEVRAKPPKASFEIQGSYAGAAVTLAANAQGEIDPSLEITRWEWAVNGMPIGEEQRIQYVFPSPGKYTVTLKVTGPGGSDTISKVITIFAQQTAQFTWTPENPVSNQPVAFINEANGLTEPWAWDFGDGGSSAERNPQHTYAKAGKYIVTLTGRGDGGSRKVSREITAGEPKWKIAATPDAGWQGKPVSFLIDGLPSSDLRFTWDFGDGSKPLESPGRVEHSYGKVGKYLVSARLKPASGAGSDLPAVPPLPFTVQAETVALDFTANAPRSLAIGPRGLTGPIPVEVTFKNLTTGPIKTYGWDFGDGQTSNDPSPSHTYSHVGPYRVKLKMTDQFNREYITTESQEFAIQATGWRPPKWWRWPAVVIVFLLGNLVWRTCLPRKAFAKWQETGVGISKKGNQSGKDLLVGPEGSRAVLQLHSSLWLRKWYSLDKTNTNPGSGQKAGKADASKQHKPERQVTTHKRKSDKDVTDGRIKKGDKLGFSGGPTLQIMRLNDGPSSGLIPQLTLVLMTATATWLTWSLFL